MNTVLTVLRCTILMLYSANSLNQDKFDTFQWNFVRQKWRVMWNYVIFGNSLIVINNSKKKKQRKFLLITKVYKYERGWEIK